MSRPCFTRGVSQIWGGNRLAGNSWRRLKLFNGLGRDAWQAPSLAVGGVRQLGGTGQAQGLPLRGRLGEILSGRHGGGDEAARWGRRWSPRDDNFVLPSHSLRRELDRGRCGGGAPAQGRPLAADRPTAVVSSQWSETVFPLPQSWPWNGHGPVVARDFCELAPILGCRHRERVHPKMGVSYTEREVVN